MMKRIISFLFMTILAHLTTMISVSATELTQYTATQVQRAYQLQQEDKLPEAIKTLQKLELKKHYDLAYVARMLGVFYWQDNQPDNAIEQLNDAVESGFLAGEQVWSTRRMLADILLSQEQFAKAIPHYYKLANTLPKSEEGSVLWMRIAQSHYQIAQWEKSLIALNKYEQFNRPDTVPPLSLKLGAQLQLKQWINATSTLERLLVLQPDKVNWWRQLVGIQLRLNQSRAALNSLSLAKLQGVELSQQDLVLLAQLYAKRGVPERAAEIFSTLDGVKTDIGLLTEQAMYWQLAKEWQKSISTWSLAAKLNPKYHWNVAQLLIQEGQYRQALVSLVNVSEKHKQADVALAKTRVFYKLNQLEKALISAKHAYNITPSTEATSWIKYLTQLKTALSSASS